MIIIRNERSSQEDNEYTITRRLKIFLWMVHLQTNYLAGVFFLRETEWIIDHSILYTLLILDFHLHINDSLVNSRSWHTTKYKIICFFFRSQIYWVLWKVHKFHTASFRWISYREIWNRHAYKTEERVCIALIWQLQSTELESSVSSATERCSSIFLDIKKLKLHTTQIFPFS